MDTIKEIFDNLGEDQVLVVYLDDECSAVMTKDDKVSEIFGTEFAIIRFGEERLPVPVEMISKIEIISKMDFVMRTIVKMAEEDEP